MPKQFISFYILICTLISFILPPVMAANNHIRVVLDISKSLSISKPTQGWPTDPKRLAVLSTILLYDLARPNPSLGDSFAVIPFDEGKDWKWEPGDSPPKSKRPAIRVEPGDQRDKLVTALNSLKYNGEKTYYYPGLLRAIEELKEISGNKSDVKTLIFVTDGLPELPTREQEALLIRANLIPLIEQHNIHLYIIAFGQKAYQNQPFFENMITSSDGFNRLGEFLVDKNGNELLSHIIKIFSANFGFTFEPPQNLPYVKKLDLEGGMVPPRVAVIVYSNRWPKIAPTIKLTPPPQGKLNMPDGIQSARERGGSYSLTWVLSPNAGQYRFRTNIRTGSVAILRPSNVELEVLPAPPYSNQTEWAVAGKELHLRVLVKSPTGAKGDPGEVKLSYTPFGENIPDPLGEKLAPPPGMSEVTPDGRIYNIVVHFPKHPHTPTKDYTGYLELEAYRGRARVGALRHPILIRTTGIFHYTGGALDVNLGILGVDSIRCKPLIFETKTKPQHYGEVDFELKSMKWPPWGHRLEIHLMPSARTLTTDGTSLPIRPNEQFEVCLKTEDDVASSTANSEKWLELRVKGSNEPEHRVPIRLHWQVQGLTFWQRWGWLILSILAVITLLILIIGFVSPQRFSASLAVTFVPEREDLDEQFPLPIKQWKGVRSGFFRNARAFLQADYRISGKGSGALAALFAEKGGTRVAGIGNPLYRETLDGDWENVAQEGRRVRPGDIFRIGEKGPYFRIAVKGR